MRKIRNLTALALAALMTLCALTSCAAGLGDKNAINDYTPEIMSVTDKDGNVFTFENGEGDTAILTKYSGKKTKDDTVVVPEKFGDRTVVGIGDSAFYYLAAVVEVQLPATIKTIGSCAFAKCSELVCVKPIGSSETTGIHLPDAVEEIGAYAFVECEKLTTAEFGTSLTKIGDYAFMKCEKLVEVTLPASLETIGNAAFWGCKGLTEVTLPETVTSIGDLCFYNCTGLAQIKLNKSLTSIGVFAFVTESSTLKDKIDPASYEGNEYVTKYVASIAEPTVEETTAEETGAEAEA